MLGHQTTTQLPLIERSGAPRFSKHSEKKTVGGAHAIPVMTGEQATDRPSDGVIAVLGPGYCTFAYSASRAGTNRELDLIIVGKEAEMVLCFKEAPMPVSVETQLKSLPSLSREGLIDLWQTLFHSEPDPKLRKPFMIRFLAYRIQEQAFGALTSSSERRHG